MVNDGTLYSQRGWWANALWWIESWDSHHDQSCCSNGTVTDNFPSIGVNMWTGMVLPHMMYPFMCKSPSNTERICYINSGTVGF